MRIIRALAGREITDIIHNARNRDHNEGNQHPQIKRVGKIGIDRQRDQRLISHLTEACKIENTGDSRNHKAECNAQQRRIRLERLDKQRTRQHEQQRCNRYDQVHRIIYAPNRRPQEVLERRRHQIDAQNEDHCAGNLCREELAQLEGERTQHKAQHTGENRHAQHKRYAADLCGEDTS